MPSVLQHINLCSIQEQLDYINLKTYDFFGSSVDVSGHHAQLFTPEHPHCDAAHMSCQAGVNHLLQHGVKPSKILLGIPLHGRSFLGVTDIGQRYAALGGQDGAYDYAELPRPGATEHVDETVGAAYSVGDRGGFISCDNQVTVRMKATYANEVGFAGLFYWQATGDKQGKESLVETGFDALHQDLSKRSEAH